jgi:zinc transport system substrate-binding protein
MRNIIINNSFVSHDSTEICRKRLAILAIVIALVLYPVLAQAKEIKIATSFYPMYIMALNVVKDVPGVKVFNTTPLATGCLHDYSLSAADMKKLADADVLITNGAGMESFLETVAGRFKKLRIIPVSEGIQLLLSADGSVNPHVWVSIGNAMKQVRNLSLAMASYDPDHARLYEYNSGEYIRRLQALADEMHGQLKPFSGRQIITFHEAFPYFASEFGFKIAAVIEREPGSAPGAQELARTIDLINASGIKALFIEPQYPPAVAQTIARETGAGIYVLDPAVTGPDSPGAYEAAMRKNLSVLVEALKQER